MAESVTGLHKTECMRYEGAFRGVDDSSSPLVLVHLACATRVEQEQAYCRTSTEAKSSNVSS